MIDIVKRYYEEVDSVIEQLSHMQEGKISNLQSWVLCYRKIIVAKLNHADFYCIKVIADQNLEKDEVEKAIITTQEEFEKYSGIIAVGGIDFWNPPSDYVLALADLQFYDSDNKTSTIPISSFQGCLTYISGNKINEVFTMNEARKEASEMWNAAITGMSIDSKVSFLYEVKIILDKLSSIIKRKSFLERRIHRFIHQHKRIILPAFKNCYYEYPLYLQGKKNVADFILEREAGFPSILLELENPIHNLYKKNGELTAEANHAREQVKTWAKFIQMNPENTKGDLEFLNGPHQRMVIMGRGLEYLEEMKCSKYSDTIMWTYDLLIKEARDYWNSYVKQQCETIGIEGFEPI